MQTTQFYFRLNPLPSDSQPTAASWMRWIGYAWSNARSRSSVRRSWSCLSDLWDSQSNANPITVQCKEGKLPTLHCTVIGLTRERFVALGLRSWTHLRTRYWGVYAMQGLKTFAACAWPMVLRKLGNRWKWKGESWFQYRKVLL